MCILEVFGYILVSLLLVSGKPPPEKCDRNWEKVGCFHDNYSGSSGRVYPYELVNRRSPRSNNWDGHIIDWNKWPESLHALACKCAEKTRKLNYEFFGLQYYGECWSGPTTKFYRDGRSKECIGDDYKQCNYATKTECVGKASTNFIYRLKVKTTAKVNGGWSKWSLWSDCSAPCNGGKRNRKRKCNNPEPKHGGKECDGKTSVEKACNTEKCEGECQGKLDISVILDVTKNLYSKNWKEASEFVKRFSKEFNLSADKVNRGVVSYAWFPSIQDSVSDDKPADLAPKLEEKKMPCKDCNVRRDVQEVIVVITDGNSTIFSSPISTVVKPQKESGAHIIAIGVGDSVDINELRDIATNDDHVFLLNGDQYPDDSVNKLVKTACLKSHKL